MINFENETDELNKDLFLKLFNSAMKLTGQTYNKLECNLHFVSSSEIHELNKEYRGVDKPTDVLSFPLLEGAEFTPQNFPYDVDLETGALSLGDIFICEQVAHAQAEEYGHSYLRELTYLFVHGLLHLLGYDHMEEDEKKQMRAMEEKVLLTQNITRGEY